MEMMNALTDEGGVDAISRELGIDQQTAQKGVGALLPAILDGLRGQTGAIGGQSSGGLGSLVGLSTILGSLGGGSLLTNVLAREPTDVDQGNQVLGQIFGGKDTSRAVAADAAQKSGLSSDLLKKMLPFVAMLAAGYLAKRMGQPTAPAGAPAGTGAPPPDQDGGLLGSLLGGGGSGVLGSILSGLSRR
ncbi:MAG: DUF937 domain-containing protein [Sphingomonas sp.]|nr:DUF937 domain-containing protein [Sphingomonas sp.]